MSDPLAQKLKTACAQVATQYHRLVVLVGQLGTGKTAALRQFAEAQQAPLVNVNLELSRALLDVPRAQRAVAAPRLLKEIVEAVPGDTVLLDNIEMLFAPDLQLDPLRALQQLARDRTVVTAWNGRTHAGRLLYAEPSHPEYRDYKADGLVLIAAEDAPKDTDPRRP
jgi:transcriptional regulator of acetoin/glycerol metabolism